ncbi:MAG: DNA repair protein RecN [Clostridia bacterium]|nr:DNA repair protein RecN [Clostridia bacterium]
MLQSLKIENIAVIEKAEIEFKKGFNVLTGETGAGKSIIIDSLCAALGERTSRDLIRTGANSAKVTAVFEDISADVKETAEKIGVDCTDGTLIISRVINSDGRNICKINGSPATVGMLKTIGEATVNIHGQHDSQALLNPDKHIAFIDGVAENGILKSDYKNCFSELVKIKRTLDAVYTDEDSKAARLDYLDYQINELENSALYVGEKEELTKKKKLLLNAKNIKKAFDKSYLLLCDENGSGICDLLNNCKDTLNAVSEYSEEAEKLSETIENIYAAANDLTAEIRNACDNFSYNEEELSAVDERLDLIFRITSKYGGTEQSALEALERMRKEKQSIIQNEHNAAELEQKLGQLSDELKNKAAALTESRKRASRYFENRVTDELSFLDMPYVKFVVKILPAAYSSKGADDIEFLISANPGEEPKPLAKIASGGELSRIMLAIKNVISAKDDIDTLIFDEIDSGVSGRAAQKIALKLKEVSEGRQVICITHLAQIAAVADRHLKISKSVSNSMTYTKVDSLNFEQRKEELARIMGGLEITQLQLENAHEMLINAGIYWD